MPAVRTRRGAPGGDRRRRGHRRRLGAALPADGLRRRRLRPGAGRPRRPAAHAGGEPGRCWSGWGCARGASPDRLTFHGTLAAAVAGADVVQENAPEDGPVKRAGAGRHRRGRPAGGGHRVQHLGVRDDHAAGRLRPPAALRGRASVQPAVPDPAGRGGGRRADRSGRRGLADRVLRRHGQAPAAAEPGTARLRREPAAGGHVAGGAAHGGGRGGHGRGDRRLDRLRARACAGR